MRTMINLLPPTYRRQQVVRKRAIQWGSVICAVLLASWTSHRYAGREQQVLSRQLEVLAREHRPSRTMLKQLVDMRGQLEDLQQQEAVARELEYQRHALVLLAVISQTAQKTKGRLRVTKFELTGFQSQRHPDKAAEEAGPAGGLHLAGVSLDNPSVAELLDGLQDSGIFSRVELRALKEREDNGPSLRDYEVRCEF